MMNSRSELVITRKMRQ